MDNVPYDPTPYEPTPEDWAEYAAWSRSRERTECCPRHNWQDPYSPCPECEEEEYLASFVAGEEPCTDLWYLDLLLIASFETYDPRQGWRSEQ